MKTPAQRRRRRWLAVIGLGLVLVIGTAFAVLRLKFEGPSLGDNIASILNKRMRGRIEIGSIEWSTSSLTKAITGGWFPVTIHDVRVWDDCALSAAITGDAGADLRSGDPNEDCTPDDRLDEDPKSTRKPRKLLIRSDLVTAEIDAHAIMFGNHDFVFRNVWLHGGEALIEQTREPYPLTDYDRTTVSIISAFSGRMKAAFRAGIFADAAPPVFDLRDIHIQGLNLTLHMSPSSGATPDQVEYAFTARLENVNVDVDNKAASNSYLYMDANDPLVAKFYVRLAVAAERASIRILDHGPRAAFRLPALTELGHPRTPAEHAIVSVLKLQHTLEHSFEAYPPPGRSALYTLELSDIKLDRLAQLPHDWSHRDFVANTLEVDLHARALPCLAEGATTIAPPDERDAAQVHLSGELFNYWDRPYDGAWNLKLDGKNLGPTLRSCIKPTIGGDQLDGMITLTGPFVAQPAIGLDMKGVDLDIPLGAKQAPLRLTLAEMHGKVDLVNEEGYIEKTKALVRNGKEPGEVELSATFGLKPLYSNAQVEIVKPIDVGRFLPASVATSVGKFLHGRLRAIGDTERGFELSDFDLGLGMSERDTALRLHHGRLFTKNSFQSIQIEKVYADAGKSHAMIDGLVDIKNDNMRLVIDGDFPDLDVWLQRFRLPALFKSAGGGQIVISGKLSSPQINVNTTLAGVPCIDQLKLENLSYAGSTVDIQRMSSPGLGGTLSGSGRIRVGGAPVIERLDLAGAHLDASKICGLKGIAKGTIDEVNVHLHGTVDAKRAPLEWLGLGQIYARADKLSILDDRYTGIAACVNRDDDQRCRPRPLPLTDDARAACDDGKRAADQGGSGFCLVAAATREAGGQLDATIAQLPASRRGAPGHLAGLLSLRDLPMALIDELRGAPPGRAVGGLASLTARLQGTAGAPQAQGAIDIVRGWIAEGFLGDARIDVNPAIIAGVPGVELKGTALAGRLAITGSIGTAAPYPVELSVSGQRIEIDPFLDLQTLVKLPGPLQGDPIQAWATGKLTVKTELAAIKQVEPEAWVELTELAIQIDHRASDGRVTPLVVRVKDQNSKQRTALSIHATPSSYELACRDAKAPGGRAACSTILETPAGDIELSGYARRPALPRPGAKPVTPSAEDAKAQIALKATGTLDLAKLRVLLDQSFDYVAGRVALDASIAGPFAKPTFELAIDLDPQQIWRRNEAERNARRAAYAAKITRPEGALLPGENPLRLRPIGSDTLIAAPGGLIKLANGSVGFTDVLVQVRDERHSDEPGELHVAGNIALDGATPSKWSVFLTGKIAGKMLQVIEPSFVSQAEGMITIDADDPIILSGDGPSPNVSGTVQFDHFSIFPRGVRRELTFATGSIEIGTEQTSDKTRAYTLTIANVNGSLEDGKLTNIGGAFRFKNGSIDRGSLRFNATSIPFHIPQTLDLTLSASNIELTLDAPGANWRVTGTVTVVDGAYLRNFELTDRIQAIGVNSAPSKPFWEEYPALGTADLNLTLVVQLFAVRDNIATIEFRSDAMAITGTPPDPRLSGQIRVTHGEFRIPGTRAAFTRTSGTVDFAENQHANNPALNVTSDADYRDLSGQDHVITATIGGTLQALSWDLKTSTGYNKSQTLSLLVLGRNQEQLRRSLGDQNLGGDPTRVDPTTNPSQGFADQIVKDLAGDWVSDLLGSSLTKLTGLDVLRIEIGFGSIGFHLEKKVFQNLKVTGDAEQTIRGTTIKVQSEIKTPYPISLQGGYLNQNYYDPAEQDIEDINVKLVYRVLIP